MAQRGPFPGLEYSDQYKVHYRDITLSLHDMGTEPILDVRFPMISASENHYDMNEHAYWSNHPECIERTYVEEMVNPPVEGTQAWFHIVFDVTRLLGPLDLRW